MIVQLLFFFPFVLFCIYFVSVFVFGCIYIYAIALVCLAVVANNEWLKFLIVCLRYDGDGAECSFFSLFSFLASLTLQFTYNGIWKFHISIKCFVFRLSRLVCWRFFSSSSSHPLVYGAICSPLYACRSCGNINIHMGKKKEYAIICAGRLIRMP